MDATVFTLVGLIGLPILAVSGWAYRGAYLGLTVVGLLMMLLFNDLHAYGDASGVAYGLFALGAGLVLGGALGACLYRRPRPADLS